MPNSTRRSHFLRASLANLSGKGLASDLHNFIGRSPVGSLTVRESISDQMSDNKRETIPVTVEFRFAS
jgi:hypothetical protein